MRATRAVIHLENLRHNIKLVRDHIGSRPTICMAVKADGYGHGVLPIVQTALAAGVEQFAVATVEEGAELRRDGIEAPILLMSFPLLEEVPEVVEHNLAPFASDEGYLAALEGEARRRGSRLDVHLKIDTGMGRIGCTPQEAPAIARRISESRHLRLAGVGTHFPASDMRGADYTEFTSRQVRTLRGIVEGIRELGVDPGFVHAANSGAIVGHPQALFDLVRPGIILYGYYPSGQQARVLDVRPVMELESRIVFLKRVPAGTGISYGLTYHTAAETTIATVPCGYGDGYSRLLSGKGQVLLNGERYPVVGRVCMDQLMIDLGPRSSAKLYDRVVLFGPDPAGPTAEHLAQLAGTIPYEITCNINKRVPRVYTGSR